MPDPARLQDGRRPQCTRRDDHHRRANDELPSWTSVGAREGRLDTDRAAALDEDAHDTRVGYDPGACRGRLGEVDSDPGTLGPARTAERAAAAVTAVRRIPSRRCRVPSERASAAKEDRVFRRD